MHGESACNRCDSRLLLGSPPYYMGKTTLPHMVTGLAWEHPHLCVRKTLSVHLYEGVHPAHPHPLWGKLAIEINISRDSGNTPTHVRKILWLGSSCPRSGSHPHLHGENLIYKIMLCIAEGSPPYNMGKTKPSLHSIFFNQSHPHIVWGKSNGRVF